MAEKKGFDLAGLMKSVSKMNTREQIEYIPFELLDADPNNFYSLDDIEELADSIATVGLVHPLRVRQAGEHYVITSGHRRRAAIQLLIDSGEDWSQGVPCVVDRGESEPEFEELKLIFANRQRQKTSAELSLEAERTDELFCKLREKGYEFPGRMQEHVAAALGVKASKLKRLHAIRANLIPQLLNLYDHNEINEAQAYELQQFPQNVQFFFAQQRNLGDRAQAYRLERARKNLDTLLHPKCCCPDGSDCSHTILRVKQTALAPNGCAECPGGCCLECRRSQTDCKYRCQRAKQQIQADKIEREAKEARERKKKDKILDEHRATLAGKYAALAVLAKDAGMKPEDPLPLAGCRTLADVEQVAGSCGRTLGEYEAREDTVFNRYSYSGTVVDIADRLGCSVDFLLERTKEPAVNRGDGERRADDIRPYEAGGESDAGQCPALRDAAAWQTGEPEDEGWYACLGVWADIPERMLAYWRDGEWYEEKNSRRKLSDTTVLACYPLPELPDLEDLRKEVKTWKV